MPGSQAAGNRPNTGAFPARITLLLLLASAVLLSGALLHAHLRFRTAEAVSRQRLLRGIARRTDALHEQILLELTGLQYRPELQAAPSQGASEEERRLAYLTISGELGRVLRLNEAILEAKLVFREQAVVLGASGSEPLPAAERKDPDTYGFLKGHRSLKQAWIPRHQAFVGGRDAQVLVLVMPSTFSNGRSSGTFLVYLSVSRLQEILLGGLPDADAILILDRDGGLLLASAGSPFPADAALPSFLERAAPEREDSRLIQIRESRRLMVSVSSDRTAWRYIGIFPLSDGRWNHTAAWMIGLLILVLLACLGLLLAGAKRRPAADGAGEDGPWLPLSRYPYDEQDRLFAALRQGPSRGVESATRRFLRRARDGGRSPDGYAGFIMLLLLLYLQGFRGGKGRVEALEDAERTSREAAGSRVTEAARSLVRFFRSHPPAAAAAQAAPAAGGRPLRQGQPLSSIDRAVAFIHLHYSSAPSLKEVARASGFSSRYFSTLFHTCTGRTMTQYISGLRIEQAKRLLAETDDSVTSIARRTGYRNSQYFARVFRRHTALSPLEYRRVHSPADQPLPPIEQPV